MEWLLLPVLHLELSVFLLGAFILVCAFLDPKFSDKITASLILLLIGEVVLANEWGLVSLALFLTVLLIEGARRVVMFSSHNIFLSFIWTVLWYYLFEFILWGLIMLTQWGQSMGVVFPLPNKDDLLLVRHLWEVAAVIFTFVFYRYLLKESHHG